MRRRVLLRTHLLAGVGFPVGRRDFTGEALLPNGMTREVRLPYAMQLGSGTWDAMPGIVVQTKRGKASVGGQLRARVRSGENAEGYRLGNDFLATAWAMSQPIPAAALTARLHLDQLGGIEGQDAMIGGPVPTADPANYGGSRLGARGTANQLLCNGGCRERAGSDRHSLCDSAAPGATLTRAVGIFSRCVRTPTRRRRACGPRVPV